MLNLLLISNLVVVPLVVHEQNLTIMKIISKFASAGNKNEEAVVDRLYRVTKRATGLKRKRATEGNEEETLVEKLYKSFILPFEDYETRFVPYTFSYFLTVSFVNVSELDNCKTDFFIVGPSRNRSE